MLDYLLGSRLRARVIGWIFTHADERIHVRRLALLIGEDSTNTGRELKRLSEIGLLDVRREGRQLYYQARREGPLFGEFHGIAVKTTGLADVLRTALKLVEEKVRSAFVFGSFARGAETAASDVDLAVVGDVSFAEIVASLDAAQRTLAREINPAVYPPGEFAKKAREGHHFIVALLEAPKIFVLGGIRELESVVGRRMADGSRPDEGGNPGPLRNRRPRSRRLPREGPER